MSTTVYCVTRISEDLKVSSPETSPVTHLYINDERFELINENLVQNGFSAYQLKDGEIYQGKDFSEWLKWVNDPIEFDDWIANMKDKTRNPRQMIINGQLYQVMGAMFTYPEPRVRLNGKTVGYIVNKSIVWM